MIGAAEPVAAMAADVETGVDVAGGVAHDKHWILAHTRRQKIAGQRDLAVMAQKEPAPRKNLVQLLFVDRRLDKNAPAEEPPFGIDETGKIGCHISLLLSAYSAACASPGAAISSAQRR